MRAGCACSAIPTPRSRPRAATAKSRCRSRSHGPAPTRPYPTSARRRYRLTSPPTHARRSGYRRLTRPCSRSMRARSPPPQPGCILRRHEAALRGHGVGLHRLTLHVGAGTFLPVKVDEQTSEHKMHAEWAASPRRPPRPTKPAPTVAVSSLSAPPRCGCWKVPRPKMHGSRRFSRNLDLHHARLSFSRGRYLADKFPSAALDAVHAGLGVQRPGGDETRLRARHRARLPVLLVWRRALAVSRA